MLSKLHIENDTATESTLFYLVLPTVLFKHISMPEFITINHLACSAFIRNIFKISYKLGI